RRQGVSLVSEEGVSKQRRGAQGQPQSVPVTRRGWHERIGFLGEVWVKRKGLGAAASANPSSSMVAGTGFAECYTHLFLDVDQGPIAARRGAVTHFRTSYIPHQTHKSKTSQKEDAMTLTSATQRGREQAAEKNAIRPFHVNVP